MMDGMVIGGEKRKAVVFNLENAEDRELYLYYSREKNFSPLVKQLLLAEMRRRETGGIMVFTGLKEGE
jgi:hypothetical protein